MGEIRARDQERRLRKAIQRAEAVTSDASALIVSLKRLAATLPSVRPGVTNDPPESKKHARALARELALDKDTTRALVLAAELHEIGKATIDRAALYEPTELDADKRAIVDSHAANAAELASGIGKPEVVSALALQNERHDGTGPRGIEGDDLPFIARALSVIAAYVAMTSKRPFRPALDRAHAIEVLRAESGWQFDPYIVDAFIETLPQQRAASIAASAGASFTRPVRSARLAYRRHGRASTVAVSSFSAAAILIGASTLAPDGIGRAIERLGWPKQDAPATATEGSTSTASVSFEAEGSLNSFALEAIGSESASATLGGFAAAIGAQATETTEIEGDYAYRSPSGLGGETGYTSYPAYREGAPPEKAEQPDSGEEDGTSEENTTAEESEPERAEEPPPTEPEEPSSPEPEETASPEPEETSSPEPEETSSPEPEETSSPEPEEAPDSDQPTPDEPTEPEPASPDDGAPEQTEDEKEKEKKDGQRGNSRSSNGFNAYQPEEEQPESDDPEFSENETDSTETEEADTGSTDTQSTETDGESTEATSTTSRDTTPAWGSLH